MQARTVQVLQVEMSPVEAQVLRGLLQRISTADEPIYPSQAEYEVAEAYVSAVTQVETPSYQALSALRSKLSSKS